MAELSGDFAMIMGRLRPDYQGEIVRSSDCVSGSAKMHKNRRFENTVLEEAFMGGRNPG